MKTEESFSATSNKAWNGLIQGATEIYTIFGIFTLGDLFVISRDEERYKNKIGLILQKGSESFVIPGYEIDRTEHPCLDNSIPIAETKGTTSCITNLRTQKAEWN